MTDNRLTPNDGVALPTGYALSDGTVLPTGSVRLGDGTVRLPDGSVLPGVTIPVVEHDITRTVQVPVERTVQVDENPVVVQSVQAIPQPVVQHVQPVVQHVQPVVRQVPVVQHVQPVYQPPVVHYAPQPEPSHWSLWWWLPLLLLGLLGALLWHGCHTAAVTPVHTTTLHTTITETIRN